MRRTSPRTAPPAAPPTGLPPDLAGLFLRRLQVTNRSRRTPATPPPAAPPPPPAMAATDQAPVPSSSPLWSDGLPPELAGLVIRRLPSLADRARFGAVCRRWGLAAQQQAPTLPAPLPWIGISSPTLAFQSFPDGELHALGSAQPFRPFNLSESWVMFMRPGSMNFLKNPLSGATMPLPGTLRSADRVLDFDFAVLRKFIVCSDELVVAMAGDPLLIACCRPGTFMSSSWSTAAYAAGHERDYDYHYQDIAFHHGNVYGMTTMGNLCMHKISEDSATGEMVLSNAKQVIKGSDTWLGPGKEFFLVVSRGDLLLVKWNHINNSDFGYNSGPLFEVFRADLEMSRWSEVSSPGDQALFVSGMCSKAVSTSGHGDYLRENCIYFMEYQSSSGPNNTRRGATVCGMYDLRDNMYHKTHILQCRGYDPAWFFPHK